MARGIPTFVSREFHLIAVGRYATDEASFEGCATGLSDQDPDAADRQSDQGPDVADRQSDQDPDAADCQSKEEAAFYEDSEIAWHTLPLPSDDEDEDDLSAEGDGEQGDEDDEDNEDDDNTGAEVIAEEDMEEEMDYHDDTEGGQPFQAFPPTVARPLTIALLSPPFHTVHRIPSVCAFSRLVRRPSAKPCSAPYHLAEVTNTPGRASRSRNKGKARARAEDLDSEDSDSEWLPNSRAKRLPTRRKSKVRPSAGPSPLQAGPSASRKRGRESCDEAEYAPAQKVPRVRKTERCRQPQTTSKKPKEPKELKLPKEPEESKTPKESKESKLPQAFLRSLTTGSGQCSQCSQEFDRTTYPDYKAHMMSHDLSPLPKQLPCPLPDCGWKTPKRMAKQPTLKVNHLIEHTYDRHLSQQYRCVYYWSTESPPCTWHANSAKRVAQHMEQTHGKELLIQLRGRQKTIERL
ncbi:hypothetical protein C8Q74DRAFT_1283669 [Fomes fomentarius]|nr:hypothetical protein C8Q74DRAFT_1283669 [Fomes fomentarius]